MLVALAVILVLVAVAGGTAVWRLRAGSDDGWGSPARVVAALGRAGLSCGTSAVLRPATTICAQERDGREAIAGITTDGFAVQARAHVTNLDPDNHAGVASFATSTFQTLVGAASDGGDRGQATDWVKAHAGSSDEGSFGMLSVSLDANGPDSLSILVVVTQGGGGAAGSPKGTSLPNVTTDRAQAYFSGIGLACPGVDGDVDFCSADPPDYYAEASADLDPDAGGSQADRELHYLVVAGTNDLSRIVDAKLNENARGMVALVFPDRSDQQRIASWVSGEVAHWAPNAWHDLVVKGITVQLLPFNSTQTNGQPAIGWRLNLDVTAYPT